MSTQYSEIFERFDMLVQDYNLDRLFNQNVTDYEDFVMGYLKSARSRFRQCRIKKKTLSQLSDDANKVFLDSVSDEEQNILASLMAQMWLEREINSLLNLRASVTDVDFKRISEANMLNSLVARRKDLERSVNHQINEYSWYKTYLDKP